MHASDTTKYTNIAAAVPVCYYFILLKTGDIWLPL
jgi:hypothetical protein